MKRIVLCCDGTWNSADQQENSDGQPTPTNVIRVAYRVAKASPGPIDAMPQVAYYEQGVGTGNLWDKISGGAFGLGLTANVFNAYRFLALNYEPGDEIFLFGFSRGAYTARSIAGMIRKCGILRRDRIKEYLAALALYKNDAHPNDAAAVTFRTERSINGAAETPIKFVGVWDTVGALGVPKGNPNHAERSDFDFADNELSGAVKNGFHALAIDEKRVPFVPTTWTLPLLDGVPTPKPGQRIEQVWFSGVHSDAGGGYKQRELSDIPLKWMLDRAQECGLAIDGDAERAYPLTHPEQPSADMHDSMTWYYKALTGGAYDRPVGLMRDPGNLAAAPSIVDPTQSVHASVYERWKSKANYRPKELQTYFNRPTTPQGQKP